jgi:choline-sulfatase
MKKLLPANGLNLALLSFAAIQTLAQTKPNIVFIMTDQQEYHMLSCEGNKWLSTPNIDKIASMGYRFENNYCANPVSMPSRFSLLTGHYASEVGVKENTSAWDKEKVNEIVSKGALGVLFQNAGYETLYSGKTHLYGTRDVSEYGFKLNTLDPYDGPAIYAEKVLAEKGKVKQEKPFFLFLSFLNPHDICYKAGADKRYPDNLPPANVHETSRLIEYQKTLTAEEYQKQIPPAPSNLEPINGELPDMVSMAAQGRNWDMKQWDFYRWMYYRLTESVDNQIGRVLSALEKSGLMENTIIVFTSDHGEMDESHKLITKNVMFEESQRVPLIFAGKGIKANFIDKKTLTCNGLDFLPTICDLVGIQSPKGLHGVSLKSYLTGQGKSPNRKFIITEDYNAFQIHDGRYKFTIYELPGNPEMLTDLVVNPEETINYANDPSYAGIKGKLKKLLMEDLTNRNLTPLKDDRTIQHLRQIENEKGTRKGERSKLKEDFVD